MNASGVFIVFKCKEFEWNANDDSGYMTLSYDNEKTWSSRGWWFLCKILLRYTLFYLTIEKYIFLFCYIVAFSLMWYFIVCMIYLLYVRVSWADVYFPGELKRKIFWFTRIMKFIWGFVICMSKRNITSTQMFLRVFILTFLNILIAYDRQLILF